MGAMFTWMPSRRKAHLLTQFKDASTALAKFLWEREKLEGDDRDLIENNLLIVQLAYTAWKHADHKKRSKEFNNPVQSKASISEQ
jgi:hypothetical protein